MKERLRKFVRKRSRLKTKSHNWWWGECDGLKCDSMIHMNTFTYTLYVHINPGQSRVLLYTTLHLVYTCSWPTWGNVGLCRWDMSFLSSTYVAYGNWMRVIRRKLIFSEHIRPLKRLCLNYISWKGGRSRPLQSTGITCKPAELAIAEPRQSRWSE